jgi:APA family basic amino acid/polyamine antiporter
MTLRERLFAVQPHDRLRETTGPALRRVLGVRGLIAVGLGTMLGGIFTTIGVGVQTAGPGVLVSFGLSGLACVFVALCYAELAAMVPVAGSAYTYAYATLGEFVAWVIGWDLILEYGISVAPVAASWSGYVQAFLGNFGVVLPKWAQTAHVAFANGRLDLANTQIDAFAIGAVLVLALLLALGIRESASANGALVVVQVVAIVVFCVALAGAVVPGHFHPFAPTGFGGILTGASLVFFAYIGFDTVTVASEEAKNPARDVPRAVIAALAIGIVMYFAIAYVTAGTVPWKAIDPDAGMADAVKHAGNAPWLAAVVFAGAFAGTTTVMLTSLLGQIRIFYVMAKDRMLPPAVARVNARTRTPFVTTLATGAVVALFAGVIPLAELLSLVNIGTLSAFTIVCVGVLVLRVKAPHAPRPFRAPFVYATAILGASLCIYLMSGLSAVTWIRFVVWFAVGCGVYAIYGFRHSLLRDRPS